MKRRHRKQNFCPSDRSTMRWSTKKQTTRRMKSRHVTASCRAGRAHVRPRNDGPAKRSHAVPCRDPVPPAHSPSLRCKPPRPAARRASRCGVFEFSSVVPSCPVEERPARYRDTNRYPEHFRVQCHFKVLRRGTSGRRLRRSRICRRASKPTDPSLRTRRIPQASRCIAFAKARWIALAIPTWCLSDTVSYHRHGQRHQEPVEGARLHLADTIAEFP